MCCLLGAVGCASGDARTVMVAWSLVDGRSCLDTAIDRVTIDHDGNASATGACNSLPAENQISVSGVHAGETLRARALSPTEAIVYRGELLIPDPVPPVVALTLYYTGGQ